MKRYKVWIRLDEVYDDIIADSKEEAFIIASDAAISGGSWYYAAEEIEDCDEDSEKIIRLNHI